ncbi:MAG TPA: hypothetical protein VGL56_21180 [Fimbriimonadaceae bacterium]|jgi:hypothetical protein
MTRDQLITLADNASAIENLAMKMSSKNILIQNWRADLTDLAACVGQLSSMVSQLAQHEAIHADSK